MLPRRPSNAQIINATARIGRDEQKLTPARLGLVLCMAYPRTASSIDELVTIDIEDVADEWSPFPIWLTLLDGNVDFEDPSSRWYLAGREVESYECI
jgi:hypothetical protein